MIPDREAITQASIRIGPYIRRTPVLTSSTADRIFGGRFFFKCENFQKAGAFKARGALNTVLSLEPDRLVRGVATHSSGNHAQALSWSASLRGVPAFIVMPENSSRIKIEGVKEYGGRITFCEPTLQARESTLARVLRETGATEIHPYNDYRIMAGQATAAMELLEDVKDPDLLLVPVGGGGLLSGTALAVSCFSPATRVIGCEPEKADDAFRSFSGKMLVPSVNPDTIADGLRTSLGTLTFPVILEHVSGICTVSEEAIIRAMRFIWERMKIIVEPSSAVPFAAILEEKIDVRGKKTGIILSGGNVDLNALPW